MSNHHCFCLTPDSCQCGNTDPVGSGLSINTVELCVGLSLSPCNCGLTGQCTVSCQEWTSHTLLAKPESVCTQSLSLIVGNKHSS